DVRGYYHLYQVPLRLLPWFDLPEQSPVFEPAALGGIPTLFDRIEEKRVPYRSWYWRTPEEGNLDELLCAARAGDVPFLFLYACELDGTMHARGTGSPETGERIRRYEERLRAVFEEAAKHRGEVSVLLFSDHGMVDVNRTIDLMARVRSLPFLEGKDYLPFYDSTFARFWFRKPDAAREIRALLEEEKGGGVLTIDEEKRYRVHFAGREYGETIFVADAGTVIAPSFMGTAPPAAMHGYRPDERGSDGILLSNRPIPDGVRTILDLAALLEREAAWALCGVEDGARR
ncbi:MAG: alkaline phosphatase family protein, partial [Candidatus Eisenbacteria bacterium]